MNIYTFLIIHNVIMFIKYSLDLKTSFDMPLSCATSLMVHNNKSVDIIKGHGTQKNTY